VAYGGFSEVSGFVAPEVIRVDEWLQRGFNSFLPFPSLLREGYVAVEAFF